VKISTALLPPSISVFTIHIVNYFPETNIPIEMPPPSNTPKFVGKKWIMTIWIIKKPSVVLRQNMVIYLRYNGVDIIGVGGMKRRVRVQQNMVTSIYYNGVEKMGVRGISGRVSSQRIVTYIYYNGVEKMGVRGMNGRVRMQLGMVS
jgi:hypothetical protein